MRRLLMLIAIVPVAVLALTVISSAEGGDAAKGKEVYGTYCTSCHGPEGKGDGVASAALDPKPRDLSDAAYVSTVDNARLYKVIDEGGASVGLSPLMSAWGGALSEQDINDIVAYIRQDVCKCEYKAE